MLQIAVPKETAAHENILAIEGINLKIANANPIIILLYKVE